MSFVNEPAIEKKICLSSDQFPQSETINLNEPIILNGSPFDYLKSVLISFNDQILNLTSGRIHIASDIPVKSGLSSSAAVLTAMVYLIGNELLGLDLKPEQVAEIAYKCEHDILNISCGRMDQYSVSFGGVIHLTGGNHPVITPLKKLENAYFIIGNSGIQRKADIPLKQVQRDIFDGLRILGDPNLNDYDLKESAERKLTITQLRRLKGVLGVRDNLRLAFKELKKINPSITFLGELLTEQQRFLRENYEVSHPKLDKMCQIAFTNGALGGKLSGAGFGGSMFALASEKDIAIKIQRKLREFGHSFITEVSEGIHRISS